MWESGHERHAEGRVAAGGGPSARGKFLFPRALTRSRSRRCPPSPARQAADGADPSERTAGVDGELVHRAENARRRVEEARALRRREVDRAHLGGRGDGREERRLTALDGERAERVAGRVRDEEEAADTLDPAELRLAVALGLRVAEHSVLIEAVGRDRACSGLAAHEPAVRERERERHGRRGRIRDERRREHAVAHDLEDVDRARARLRRHEQLPAVRREADLPRRREEERRRRIREA